jgi:hypothetical protein
MAIGLTGVSRSIEGALRAVYGRRNILDQAHVLARLASRLMKATHIGAGFEDGFNAGLDQLADVMARLRG